MNVQQGRCPIHPFDLWTRANVGEIMPGLVSPLGWSTMEGMRNEAFRYPYRKAGLSWVNDVCFIHRFYGRVYMNVGALNRIAMELGLPTRLALRSLGGPVPSALTLPQHPLRLQRLARRSPNLLRLAVQQQIAIHLFRSSIPSTTAMARKFTSLDLNSLSDHQLTEGSRRLASEIGRQLRLLLTLNTASFGMFSILSLMCESWAGDGALAQELVVGLDASRTGEGTLRLLQIAQQASADPTLRRLIGQQPPAMLLPTLRRTSQAAWLTSALDRYIEEYGHRCVGEVDISLPRWQDDPTPLLAALREYVVIPPPMAPLRHRQTQEERRRWAEAKMFRHLTAWQRPLFALALQRTRSLMSLREDPKFYLLKLVLPLRRLYLAMAQRLIDRGLLQEAEDVFWLTQPELYRFLHTTPTPGLPTDVRGLIQERRLERRLLEAMEPPEIVGPGGRSVEATAVPGKPTTKAIKGLGASPGRARGRAHVVSSLADGAVVKAGEVLVAPAMDPGWTHLFPLTSAIVTDLGGVLSHAAVVARELGIPAVVNTRSASRQIPNGLEIEVDGDHGIVIILDD